MRETARIDINPPLSPLSIPKTNNPEGSGYPLGRSARVLLGAWSLLLVCVFATAFAVEPDPRGYGTHEALGLPRCTFREVSGFACPSCGMTTSISHFVRGRFLAAAQANCGGLVLAILGILQIPWSWLSIWAGRLLGIDQPVAALFWALLLICGTTLLQWLMRLI